ncbi:hypothetical protein MP478_00765 [Chryseobacterium sp. WG14]|uniref:hypothetical protein n=1 Tax=Chryseobacterium sp. WG14 TaxID=2926909 RepID=UPI00211E5CDF|nr:hypothetical protein [Chryseobacterium sp. WG14]MCQ9637902.1 hypothetical protein [Chryseobacterium sp. WG14]
MKNNILTLFLTVTMRQKVPLGIALVAGTCISSAQTFTSSSIWYDIIPGKLNRDSLLVQKGFKMKYSGPKKQGGFLSCYFNKKSDEWMFIHANDQNQVTTISYLLPTLQKYKKNLIDKKQLLPGEEVQAMGKTIQENKIYYDLGYSFKRPESPDHKE